MPDPVFITGVGAELPDRILTNEQLVAGMPWLDVNPQWIADHTGIRQRHVVRPEDDATDLGCRAAFRAIERSGCDPAGIDLVLLATNTARLVYPAGAALIQQRLGASLPGGKALARAAAIDLQQGCASFVAGIALATAMLQSGAGQRALVVGADTASRMVDWTDRNAMLLGDGACACVLERALPAAAARPLAFEVLGTFLRTIPDAESIVQHGVLDAGNDPFRHIERGRRFGAALTREQMYADVTPASDRSRFFAMQGRNVYRFVRRHVAATGFLEVLCRSGLVRADERARVDAFVRSEPTCLDGLGEDLLMALGGRIDRFVPHGANMVLDQELADQMRIPYERMAVALQDTGNTSAASVGLALARALQGDIRYATVAKRDAAGVITRPSRNIVVEPLQRGHHVLMLSFGAGASWNYVVARAV